MSDDYQARQARRAAEAAEAEEAEAQRQRENEATRDQRRAAFLALLRKATADTGFVIVDQGCGCCGNLEIEDARGALDRIYGVKGSLWWNPAEQAWEVES